MVNFWRPQPTLPCLGLQYSISRKTRTVVSLSSMKGVFAKSLLRKQAWRNRKKGRVGCLHQNIFTRKVTEIATIAIIIHIPRPPRPCIWRPASPSHTSLRPILDVNWREFFFCNWPGGLIEPFLTFCSTLKKLNSSKHVYLMMPHVFLSCSYVTVIFSLPLRDFSLSSNHVSVGCAHL